MKLIIQIEIEENVDRRVMNNLMANSINDIHYFMSNYAPSKSYYKDMNMGNRQYNLSIELKDNQQ